MASIGVALLAALAPKLAGALPLAEKSSQTALSALVVFGDSYSDNGNGSFYFTNGTWPPDLGYYQGRFSNGPVWADYVAGNLSVPLLDYAVGGATTSNDLIQGYSGPNGDVPVPSLLDQVSTFLSGQTLNGTSLSDSSFSASLDSPVFVLEAGANDAFFDNTSSAAQSYQAIAQAAAQLAAAYPSAPIVTIAVPDLAQLPYIVYTNDTLLKSEMRTFSDALAKLLARGIRGPLQQQSDAVVVLANVDLGPLFDDFDYYAEPEAYGFGPLAKYGSCLVGAYQETGSNSTSLCDDADVWVYWDAYHPTTHTHSWIAKQVLSVISAR